MEKGPNKQKFHVKKQLFEFFQTVDDAEFFIVRENSRRCAEFEPSDHSKYLEFYAMDATTYQEYRDVFWLTKIRSKMGVVLAISQDKFDIFPHQTPSGRLWTATHSIPNVSHFFIC